MSKTSIKRAFDLARGGDCASIAEIKLALKKERFSGLETLFQGFALRKQLQTIIHAARSEGGVSRPVLPVPIDAKIGRRVRYLRSQKDMTLDALAEAVGCPADELALVEMGGVRADALMLFLLSTALGCRVGELYLET